MGIYLDCMCIYIYIILYEILYIMYIYNILIAKTMMRVRLGMGMCQFMDVLIGEATGLGTARP